MYGMILRGGGIKGERIGLLSPIRLRYCAAIPAVIWATDDLDLGINRKAPYPTVCTIGSSSSVCSQYSRAKVPC